MRSFCQITLTTCYYLVVLELSSSVVSHAQREDGGILTDECLTALKEVEIICGTGVQ